VPFSNGFFYGAEGIGMLGAGEAAE